MIFRVHVGVALRRPPRYDGVRSYVVEAGCESDAYLIALQMASCTSVMPVWAEVVAVTPSGEMCAPATEKLV